MKKILLMGNPNVGKSAIFSRLTGVHVITSNYPGTTIEYTKGYIKLRDEKAEIIDVPGVYSLSALSKAEEIALRMFEDGDVIINIVDSTNLERNLNLTLQLLKKKKPIVVVLNFWDETKHRGVNIDVKELENFLGVPVVPTCGITGEGIKELVDRLDEAKEGSIFYETDEDRWSIIGRIVGKVQRLTHRHHTFLDRLGEFSVKPLTGIPISIIVIYLTFKIIRFIGETLIGYIFEPLFDKLWLPVVSKISEILLPYKFLHEILIGTLIDGKIDFGLSFGILTTGLFVPVAMVLPYVFAFYLVLSFLEDSGYLPRLAVLFDRVMHLVGLHGVSIIPMLLGLGCNVPGALATRIMENRRERFISAILLAISVPCMAQIAMIVGLVGRYGSSALFYVFGILFLIWLVLGIILNKILKGEAPEIFVEIPPYRIPYFVSLFKKVWMRVKWFLNEAVPFVLLGVFIINILYTFRIIDFVGKFTEPIVTKLFGLPSEAVSALMIGFLRKDVAVGMLAPLNLNLKQLIIASVILAIYFPCAATFAVLIKELGIKDMLEATFIMIITAFFVGGVLNLLL
ncbi:MAG: ferrous iron transporter B [Caldiserica bacterium]|nr:MAG: ferrous iron transporter B [Caldisericota bacterium]